MKCLCDLLNVDIVQVERIVSLQNVENRLRSFNKEAIMANRRVVIHYHDRIKQRPMSGFRVAKETSAEA